ncbi:MAG: hypothetical protein NT088_02990 [Candidatus Omnitrophica bacterium]|nr:hypothetical protein [Candidatus Omnitrophota bacterium]
MKIFEGKPADIASKDFEDFIMNTLIQSFIDYHNTNPSDGNILNLSRDLCFSQFAKDKWYKDKKLIHRTFFPQFCKELKMFFSGCSKENRVLLELKNCHKFITRARNGEKRQLDCNEIGKINMSTPYNVTRTSFL